MGKTFLRQCANMRDLSDRESWEKEKEKAAEKEREIKNLVWELSGKKIVLRKVGVGVEGETVTDDEKTFSKCIPDYTIWNVETRKLVSIADVVSTNYDYRRSKFFPVSLWKVEVMRANELPTTFIYELGKEKAEMKDRIWWCHGNDINGEVAKHRRTIHRGREIFQDFVATAPSLWTRGLEELMKKLLS